LNFKVTGEKFINYYSSSEIFGPKENKAAQDDLHHGNPIHGFCNLKGIEDTVQLHFMRERKMLFFRESWSFYKTTKTGMLQEIWMNVHIIPNGKINFDHNCISTVGTVTYNIFTNVLAANIHIESQYSLILGGEAENQYKLSTDYYGMEELLSASSSNANGVVEPWPIVPQYA
ncbi:hypothetical protein ACJX0J_040219, partial [Zea mays]